MTLEWAFAHPVLTGLLLLTAVALAAAVDFWLSERYHWRLDLKESITGYAAGVGGASAGAYALGPTRAVLVATAALVLTGLALYCFEERPEGGEPDGA